MPKQVIKYQSDREPKALFDTIQEAELRDLNLLLRDNLDALMPEAMMQALSLDPENLKSWLGANRDRLLAILKDDEFHRKVIEDQIP